MIPERRCRWRRFRDWLRGASGDRHFVVVRADDGSLQIMPYWIVKFNDLAAAGGGFP